MVHGPAGSVTSFEQRQADWLSVEDALGLVLSAAHRLETEQVPLLEALGRALASPLSAKARLPPWDNSAMDGYAVRASDVRTASDGDPAVLRVVGQAQAGLPQAVRVGEGQAVRIMTGAAVPEGADSVVRVEDTDREEGTAGHVAVRSPRDAGRNVRPGGQDMGLGEVVLAPGTTLGPGQIAVAAAAGHARVEVHRRPRVAILSNGDELRTLDHFEDVVRGRGVPETNGVMLAAAAEEAGARASPPELTRDDEEALVRSLTEASHADLVVVSGGASMGEADLVKRVLDRLGLSLEFWRVTQRPGSPMAFGHLPRAGRSPLPVFSLPGNPASAFVTFEVFVRPFLLRQAGHRRVHRPVICATVAEPLPSPASLTHFFRVVLDLAEADPVARLTGPQGSGLVHSLDRADGLAVVPRGVDGVGPGETVEVIRLGPWPGASENRGYSATRA